MKFSLTGLVALTLVSCFPSAPVATTKPSPPLKIKSIPPVEPPAPAPTIPATSTRATVLEISGITFEGVAFDSRNQRLVVADQAHGPGSQYADAAAAARALGGSAAVNAGFFTPEGAPLGLLVATGKIAGAWNAASSLGSGVWYETLSGRTAIARRDALGRTAATATRNCLQAGPLLVENSHPIGGLEATKASARTVILWDGGTRWWLGHGSACTLASLGQALATGHPAGWPVKQALNLDGGRSADLWVSETIPGGPMSRRPPWNRPVRNFLVLVAK